MNTSDTYSCATSATLDDPSAQGKHCVFRIGQAWFSVPAVSVREITIAPEFVGLPVCHPVLAGLCHLRSEFIPVLAPQALLDIDGIDRSSDRQDKMMVINGRNVWAMQVAEAAALESLETLVTPDVRMEDGKPSPVMGTAMFRDEIVRVLDPNAVFRLAQEALSSHWINPAQRPSSENGSQN